MSQRVPPRVVLAIASLGAAVAFVDATIVNIAFPSIERSFQGTPISSLSWVLNAYNIVFAAFLVAAGRVADLLGRRRLFIFGLEVFTAGSLLCAIAPSVGALVAFRVIQALGAAFLVPASLALVLHAFPPERRSHGVALLSAVGAAAAGLGPSLGGLLVSLDNWRLVFLVNLPIGAAAIVLARRHLVESRTPGRRRMPDMLGALLFALAIGMLVLGVVQGQEWGWGSLKVIAAFVAAIVLGAIFVWRCTWHRSPIIDLSLLRIRTFSAANAMSIIGAAGFYGYTLTNVLFLTEVWHYSVLRAGLALTIGPFVAVAVAGPTSRLVQRVGHRPVLVAGGLIWGGAVMWFVAFVGLRPDFLGEWLPGMVLLGIGAGTLFPNLSGAAVASAPGESFATATGMNSVARQVGAALGVAVVVAIIGAPSPQTVHATFQHAWLFGAVCLFAAGLGCLLVGRVEVEKAPPLVEAARAVLAGPSVAPIAPAVRPVPASTLVEVGPVASRSESVSDFLGRVPLFASVDPALRERLAARSRIVQVTADEWLLREGEAGDAMFIVRAGRLQAVGDGGVVLRELGRGGAIGELALLTDSPRSASIRAARASEVIAIERRDFEDVLRSSPELSLALNRALARQLRDTRAPVAATRPRPATVVLVALDPGVALPALGRALGEALRGYGPVAVLSGSEVPAPEAGEAPVSRYGPVLDRAETAAGVVLLIGGVAGEEVPWTRFCLQQADRILGVTSGGPVPAEVAARRELSGCDLVLFDVAVGECGGWAEALDPIESHVIRSASLADDVARLGRRLSGTSLGLVLSGGGARAFSHIGVLEELLAAGLAIDRVAGVSMGAVIGALFATGCSCEEIDAICFEEWVQRRPLGDFTVPRHSLIRGERFRSMLVRTFGERLVEELPVSFMCGSTELRSGQLVISRHGRLWEAVGFSICLPIIAPPQVRGRELFIDGSLTDNLPVRAMAEMGEGPIIAVDVKATFDRPSDGNGRRDQGRRDNGRPPSLGETLARVLMLGSENTTEATRRHANLVIRPRTPGIGLLEFHQIDAAREAGRAAAREALEQADVARRG